MSSICGSDMHPYAGRGVVLDNGITFGHEYTGVIVAVGDEVRSSLFKFHTVPHQHHGIGVAILRRISHVAHMIVHKHVSLVYGKSHVGCLVVVFMQSICYITQQCMSAILFFHGAKSHGTVLHSCSCNVYSRDLNLDCQVAAKC